MHVRMTEGVIARQQDQPHGTRDREEDGGDGARLVEPALVRHQLASMTQPALGDERQIEKHHGDDAAGDEERLEALGANVGDVPGGIASAAHSLTVVVRDSGAQDVRDGLAGLHTRIDRRSFNGPGS